MRSAALCLVLCVAGGMGCATLDATTPSHRGHPELLQRWPKTVAVLPPVVGIYEIGFDGEVEPLALATESGEGELLKAAREWLASLEFEVRDARLGAEDLSDRTLARHLTELRRAQANLLDRAYSGPLDVGSARAFRASMGPIVNPLASRARADALLFLTYVGVQKSGALERKDLFNALLQSLVLGLVGYHVDAAVAKATLIFTLVDGTTGELLWSDVMIARFRSHIDISWSLVRLTSGFPAGPAPAPEPREGGSSEAEEALPEEGAAAAISIPLPPGVKVPESSEATESGASEEDTPFLGR